jgi:hypothetical protein
MELTTRGVFGVTLNLDFAVQRFSEIQSGLQQNPETAEIIEEAQRLAKDTVDLTKADTRTIWRKLYDKPLYANNNKCVVRRKLERCETLFIDNHDNIGSADYYLIADIYQGMQERPHPSSNCRFTISGSLAKRLNEEFRFPAFRLHRIQGAATALKGMRKCGDSPLAWVGNGKMSEQQLSKTVATLRGAFGMGWGTVTVLHFLTDAGVAIKPDIQLIRAAAEIGAIDPGLALRTRWTDKQLINISFAVIQLSEKICGEFSRSHLRYIDKVLTDYGTLRYSNHTSC